MDDTPLDYNLLLIQYQEESCFFQFPHQGKIVTINQLQYCTPNYLQNHTSNNVTLVDYSKSVYESVGVGLLKNSSLMGTFTLFATAPTPQFSMVNVILVLSQQSLGSYDPYVVPSPL